MALVIAGLVGYIIINQKNINQSNSTDISNKNTENKSENDTKFALLLYNKIDKTTKIQDKRISDAYKLQKKVITRILFGR